MWKPVLRTLRFWRPTNRPLSKRRPDRAKRFKPLIELLEDRSVPSTLGLSALPDPSFSSFTPATINYGALFTVNGSPAYNQIGNNGTYRFGFQNANTAIVVTGITGSGGSFTANPTGTDSLTAFDGAFLVEDGPSDGHDSIAAAILSTGAPITDYNGNTFPPNWAGGPQPGADFPGYAAANFGNANYLRMDSDPNFSATGQNARYGDFSFTNITSSATALGPIYFGVHARDAAGNTGFLILEVTAPTVTTQQTPAIAVENFTPISDTAYVTGGIAPYSSTVTFNLYDNPNGNGPALFTDTEPLVNDLPPWTPSWKATATSASYTPSAVGTVYWVATFNGDTNNPAESSGLADEPVTVVAPPTVTTEQSATNVFVGATIADTAYVTGGITPYISGSTVTFNLYNNSNAIGPALFTDTETLAANGTATSASYTTGAAALTAGTVYWVATFNGDANNPVEHSGYADEPVTVTALPLTSAARTQGYWKTHETSTGDGYWTLSNGSQISSLTIGGATYTANQVVAIMRMSTGGGTSANAILILFDQLAAAELNVLNGVTASSADLAAMNDGNNAIIAAATAANGGMQPGDTKLLLLPNGSLVWEFDPTKSGFVKVSTALGQEMVTDANILNTFNNGL